MGLKIGWKMSWEGLLEMDLEFYVNSENVVK
jgi:hypothetical protein